MSQIEAGNRVHHGPSGHVGYVKAVDGDYTDVRVLTPNNEPSVLTSCVLTEDLTVVPDLVIPIPKSDTWWVEVNETHPILWEI